MSAPKSKNQSKGKQQSFAKGKPYAPQKGAKQTYGAKPYAAKGYSAKPKNNAQRAENEQQKRDMNIQWFPGHMTKTKREIAQRIKLIDVVGELLDARLPLSSRNPDMDEIAAGRPRVIILTKTDLADPNVTRRWEEYFRRSGHEVVSMDCKTGAGVGGFKNAVLRMMAEKLERDAAKGIKRPIRVMVCGIPNVGKSSLINRLAGSDKARVEDRPGVTRGQQWIVIDPMLELIDTPGVLWPKFNDEDVALRLAFTGAIRDGVLDIATLALKLIEYLMVNHPDRITERYQIDWNAQNTALEVYEMIAVKRGMLMRGGEPDYERCATMLLDEFRAGRLGRISLEKPND